MTDRLQYEFSNLAHTLSAGFDPTWYDFTEFIDAGDDVMLSFGTETGDKISNQLSSIGIKRSFSTQLVLSGDAYVYARNWIVDHEFAAVNTILVRVRDNMADQSLGLWLISSDNINWCEDGICKLSVSLLEYLPYSTCLQNTLITDNHRFWFPSDGKPGDYTDPITGLPNPQWIHPRFRYCDDIKPQFLQNFLFAISQGLVSGLFLFLGPILMIATILQDLINAVFGSGTVDFADDLEATLEEEADNITQNLIGCNRLHPTPLVRNYFINACSKCGVDFVSDIFNNPSSEDGIFYDTVHMFAPGKKGFKDNEDDLDWIPTNAPFYTVPTYAFSLKNIFNAKYKLEDGVFYFDRKDKFPTYIALDFTGSDADYILDAVCYNQTLVDRPFMSRKFDYSDDTHDQAGNDAIHRYNGVINWLKKNDISISVDPNVNPNAGRYDGMEEITVEDYGVARFTNDGVEQRLIFTINTGSFSYVNEWAKGTLLLSADTTSLNKLIVWNGEPPGEDDPQAHKPVGIADDLDEYDTDIWPDDFLTVGGGMSEYYIYNYPLMFDTYNYQGSPVAIAGGYRNLVNLHLIDDPTTGNVKNRTFNVKVELCKYTLQRLIYDDTTGDGIQARLDYLIQLNNDDKGAIESISIDYKNMEITITGRIKYAI